MKKVRMGFIALAALAGIGNAFAFNHHKTSGATYYGVKSGSNFVWETSRPHGESCQSETNAIACTITSTASPAVVLATQNALPPNSNIQSGAGSAYAM
jgi:hypothetical protein